MEAKQEESWKGANTKLAGRTTNRRASLKIQRRSIGGNKKAAPGKKQEIKKAKRRAQVEWKRPAKCPAEEAQNEEARRADKVDCGHGSH